MVGNSGKNPGFRGFIMVKRITDALPEIGVRQMKYAFMRTFLNGIATCAVFSAASAGVLDVPQHFSTINAAMMSAKKGDTVNVQPGIYHECIFVAPDVALVAGSLFKSVIDGGGKGTVVTLGTNASISGFEIRNGTIGVFCTANGATISQCRIAFNMQSGIMCVGNLPRIEDNFIVYNKGSGLQGWDVHTTTSSVNHNTIAYNSNHGVSVGGNSSIILENNIIASNNQFGIKPSEESVRLQLINNVFYDNAKFTTVLPSDNFAFDPMFINAQQLNFMLGKDSHCIGRASDNQNIGARVVY
jgi:hypothetical protein